MDLMEIVTEIQLLDHPWLLHFWMFVPRFHFLIIWIERTRGDSGETVENPPVEVDPDFVY